jgi:hypothetical protein
VPAGRTERITVILMENNEEIMKTPPTVALRAAKHDNVDS